MKPTYSGTVRQFLYIIALTVISVSAQADTTPPGAQAFVEGDFMRAFKEAATGAQKNPTADSFGLACQTGLVIGGFQQTGKDAVNTLHEALKNCERALALDPNHYVAGLSHAIAIGFEGLRLRKVSYARTSKREIRVLIEKYPANAVAKGALAGWHAAVAREGWLARLFLGASRARAKSLYAEALALPGVDLPLLYEYARFLAEGDDKDREAAQQLIAETASEPVANGLNALLIEKLAALEIALRENGKKQRKTGIEATDPFSGIDQWGTPAKTGIDAYPPYRAE